MSEQDTCRTRLRGGARRVVPAQRSPFMPFTKTARRIVHGTLYAPVRPFPLGITSNLHALATCRIRMRIQAFHAGPTACLRRYTYEKKWGNQYMFAVYIIHQILKVRQFTA